jgi:hypothetical protein
MGGSPLGFDAACAPVELRQPIQRGGIPITQDESSLIEAVCDGEDSNDFEGVDIAPHLLFDFETTFASDILSLPLPRSIDRPLFSTISPILRC